MEEVDYKKTNVFCKVLLPNGKRLTYQLPNDLREAMLQSYADGELKGIFKWCADKCTNFKIHQKGKGNFASRKDSSCIRFKS